MPLPATIELDLEGTSTLLLPVFDLATIIKKRKKRKKEKEKKKGMKTMVDLNRWKIS